jgi:hypothetical protein
MVSKIGSIHSAVLVGPPLVFGHWQGIGRGPTGKDTKGMPLMTKSQHGFPRQDPAAGPRGF